MASTTLTLTPALKINGVIPRFGSKFNFYGGIPSDYTNPILSCSSSIKHRTTRLKPVCSAGMNRSSGLNSHTFDIVIIGAGIIGLTIARQFLLGSNLSVGIIDAAAPCAGATGAGTYCIEINQSFKFQATVQGWLHSEIFENFCGNFFFFKYRFV